MKYFIIIIIAALALYALLPKEVVLTPEIDDLSIQDLNYELILKEEVNNYDNAELLELYQQKYIDCGCHEANLINMSYHDPYKNCVCDFDIVWHYIEGNIALDNMEIQDDAGLIELLNRSYVHYFSRFNVSIMSPYMNRWNHQLASMYYMGILDDEEKIFWVERYACMEYSDDDLFSQQWNKIWLFHLFGIYSREQLNSKGIANSTIDSKVCLIDEQDYSRNIWSERQTVMFLKKVNIKRFCNFPIDDSDKNRASELGVNIRVLIM